MSKISDVHTLIKKYFIAKKANHQLTMQVGRGLSKLPLKLLFTDCFYLETEDIEQALVLIYTHWVSSIFETRLAARYTN